MLTGVIRPVETRTMDVEGHSLAEIQVRLTAAAPAGWGRSVRYIHSLAIRAVFRPRR